MNEVEELRAQVAQLSAELTVVTFERDQLQAERNAVRVFFGGTSVGDAVERVVDPTNVSNRAMEVKEIAEILIELMPDKKIQAIKEMRTMTNCGLKEAKDAIDDAEGRIRWGKRIYVGPAFKDAYTLAQHVQQVGVRP